MSPIHNASRPEHTGQVAPVEVLKRALSYWQAQDVEQTLTQYSETIVYRLFSFHNAIPAVQVLRGRDAVRDMMFDVLTQFDYVRYEPAILDVNGAIARVHVQFELQHRASGQRLSGSTRQFFVVGDGLVQRINQFHDEALVTAFVRLVRS